MVSLEFFQWQFFWQHYDPWVNSTSNRNEYQNISGEHPPFLSEKLPFSTGTCISVIVCMSHLSLRTITGKSFCPIQNITFYHSSGGSLKHCICVRPIWSTATFLPFFTPSNEPVEEITVHVHFLPMPKCVYCRCMSINYIHYHFTHCEFLFQTICISWGICCTKTILPSNSIIVLPTCRLSERA
jgi:hypothetical protein